MPPSNIEVNIQRITGKKSVLFSPPYKLEFLSVHFFFKKKEQVIPLYNTPGRYKNKNIQSELSQASSSGKVKSSDSTANTFFTAPCQPTRDHNLFFREPTEEEEGKSSV